MDTPDKKAPRGAAIPPTPTTATATATPAAGTPAAADPNQFKVKWDTSRMKTSYANVCNVSSTREEVTLLFGTNQTMQMNARELTVELSDRVILSPFAAKRLYLVLQNVVSEYEKRFGELPIEDRRTS